MDRVVLSGFLNIDGEFFECTFGEHHRLMKENKITESSIHVGNHYSDTFSMQDTGPIIIEDRTKQKEWYRNNKTKLNDGQRRKLEFIFKFNGTSLIKEKSY